MVKILPSNTGDVGLIPGRGAKIPHASRPKFQNIKKKKRKEKYCNKFSKALKNGPCPKKKKNLKKKNYKSSGTLRTESQSSNYGEELSDG